MSVLKVGHGAMGMTDIIWRLQRMAKLRSLNVGKHAVASVAVRPLQYIPNSDPRRPVNHLLSPGGCQDEMPVPRPARSSLPGRLH